MRTTNHSSRFIEMFEGDKFQKVRLGDYTDLTWGDTNITKNSYVLEGYLAFSAGGPDGKLDHYDYDREGIVLSAIGADCGKTWYTTGKWSCIKNTIRFWSTSEKLDNYFLFLATRDKDYWPRRGGAQPFIPQTDARNCVIPLPPLDLQRQFISLANQADKSKFSDFKSRFIAWSSEWKNHATIRDLVETSVEKASRKCKPEDTIRYIDISSIDGESNSVIGTTEYRFSEAPSRAQQCTKKGDILVSTVRPNLKNIAVNQLDAENLVASSGFCVLRPKDKYAGLILAYVMSEPFTKKMVAEAKGSNYPAIHDSDILDYSITVPESHELARVDAFVRQSDKSKYLS